MKKKLNDTNFGWYKPIKSMLLDFKSFINHHKKRPLSKKYLYEFDMG